MKAPRYIIAILSIAGIALLFSLWIRSGDPSGKTHPPEELVIVGVKYFVSPGGSDSRDGLSEETAFLTIQHALDGVKPGDGIILLDGTYLQDFVTRSSGTPEKPIIITGSKKAVVNGTGKETKIIRIEHDHYVLSGFSVDGLGGNKDDEKSYRDKLIYAQGNDPLDGITGLRILDMDIKNAGGECVRIKYFSRKNEVARNHITGCGAYDFIFDGGGKNGEGIYIGTAPEQIVKDKNPTRDIDRSDENWIHDNTIDTQGNECVDIKEGSSDNIVENNVCTGQKDKESAGLDSRGSGNIFRKNEVYGSAGAGIRLGGDAEDDGINNVVADNFLHDNRNGGIKIQRQPQRQICGNRLANNKNGDLVGEYGSDNKNEKKCN